MSDQNLDDNSSPLDTSAQTLEEIRKMHGSMNRKLEGIHQSVKQLVNGVIVVGTVITLILCVTFQVGVLGVILKLAAFMK